MRNLKPNREEGFTLIEILVVIIIISIVASTAMLKISQNENARFEYFTKRLINLITLAEERAMLQSAVLGVKFTANSIQFYQYQFDPQTHQTVWQVLPDKLLREQTIPTGMEVMLTVFNKQVPLAKNQHSGLPQIIISSSGDIVASTILIGKKSGTFRYKIIIRSHNLNYEKVA